MSFYENYVSLCNSIGKTPSAVAIEIGLSKPAVNRWKNGGEPTDATARKVANYFGVPINDLYGKSMTADYSLQRATNEKKPAADNGNELSPAKRELIERVKQMSDSDLAKFEMLLKIVEAE